MLHILTKLKSYWRLSLELRKASREAFFYLTLAKILLKCIPIRIFSKYLGAKNTNNSKEDGNRDQNILLLIGHSIYLVSKNLPWTSKCLDQAIAAQWMLARRHLPATLYLGMKKSENPQTAYDAHAWVHCGNTPVIGFQPQVDYAVVGTYSFL